MTIQKRLHPDASDAGGGAASDTKPSKKGYSPQALTDLDSVALKVNEKWEATPVITLVWTTQAQYAELATNFSAALAKQGTAEGNAPAQTLSLRQLDTKMNTAVNDVKGGILNKFKKGNEVAQYARYGIVKESSGYTLPRDRDKRLKNLDLMIAAIGADGFDNEDWGKAFWTGIRSDYEKALTASSSNDGSISTGSGNLVAMAKQIEKVHTGLRFVLRGNYPDTYKSVYRDWAGRRRIIEWGIAITEPQSYQKANGSVL